MYKCKLCGNSKEFKERNCYITHLSDRSVKPPPLGGGYKRPIQEYLVAEYTA